jgi:beta-xylosidase
MKGYTNPVYAEYLGDPFVWSAGGEYYAVGTGHVEAAGQIEEAEEAFAAMNAELRLFPLLRSDDFVSWHRVGGALLPPDDPALGETFWAPEVACHEGRYFLYYSVGFADTRHHLRVATADHPMGPFVDAGVALTDVSRTPFAIDPSPFQDDDGAWYLFYATDFLDCDGGYRPGTALVVDRMESMTRLAGDPRVVLRATADWQRFQSDRTMYGAVWDWHTLEGPCVRKRDGRYFCLYSGGRWDSGGYGVDFGVSDSVLGPYSNAGCESGPRVLRGVPDHVVGPGHCSVVTGPDRVTDYIVYHAWNPGMTERTMRIDRLDWTPGGPSCAGPTWTEQQIPGSPQ